MKTKARKNEKNILLLCLVSLVLAGAFFLFHSFDLPAPQNKSRASFLSSHFQSELSAISPAESLPAASLLVLEQKIDLNRASVTDLEALPEVGPKLAEAIVKNRQDLGRFAKIEDLMRVKGIKKKKFERVKSYIKVE